MRNRYELAALLVACLASVCAAETGKQILESAGTRGGLVVHLGCGDGKLTASLGAGEGFLVHGLDRDPANVAAAREHIKSLGLYGKVSAMHLTGLDSESRAATGQRLPYADNLANLILSEDPGDVPDRELMRVLCPGGVALIKRAGEWDKRVKPWPKEIDEWTHFLHGPDNNAVAHDSAVDLPRQLKWLGGPKFARAHEQAASFTALVTTAGRMFYIVDEAPRADIRIPSQWQLVARDAFNGVVLWKRPIEKWIDQMRRFRSGPAEMAFRLAAKDDRVYVTLGLAAPVSILDAATGKTLATCAATENARQVLRLDDKLIVMVDTAPELTKEIESQIRRGIKPAPGSRAIVVADAEDGTTLWRKELSEFVHPTLAAQGQRLFYQTKDKLVCVDVDSGDQIWQADRPLQLAGHELGWESPTIVVHDKTVYCADFKMICAVRHRVEDGSVLWKGPSKAGYNAAPDVFIVADLVWLKSDVMKGLDPATGEVKKTLGAKGGYMHPRCYRNKATDRFFLLGNLGVQFVDIEANDASVNHWLRGTCQYGIMPANGLLYVTPDSCACNMKSKLSGLWAIESDGGRQADQDAPQATPLVTGPAFGRVDINGTPSQQDDSLSWPVYRHDASRSGVTKVNVGADLSAAWKADIGGKLSGVTVAQGKVFVASIDTHTVHALDKTSGKTIWRFTTGGRVDSPPTIYRGLALFGSADGWVYALRAADGELAWRFRAAPQAKFTFVKGQLESVWPVHGSLIIHNDELLVTAGRSSYLDGGIRLYTLEPQTGRMIASTVMFSPDPETGKQPAAVNAKDVRGVLTDILVADGDDVYMRHVKLDPQTGDHTQTGLHLFSPIGLLDDSWWHRAYWLFNDQFISHWSGWWKAGNLVPSGRILSYDERSIIGYGRDKYPGGNTGQFRGGEQNQLFACDRPAAPIEIKQPPRRRRKGAPPAAKAANQAASSKPAAYRWVSHPPFHVRSLVVAGDVVFAAGPPDLAQPRGVGEAALKLENPDATLAAWHGNKGGRLWAVSIKDGRRIGQYELDSPPVFDGMAATAGQLFISTMDGRVVCLAK